VPIEATIVDRTTTTRVISFFSIISFILMTATKQPGPANEDVPEWNKGSEYAFMPNCIVITNK